MTEQHRVSIIMPAYNAEQYITESIRSVLDQTYRNWELIVVDDGSTDKTAEIVQGFTVKDKRIKYIFQENGRLGKARNTGLKDSTGRFIAFLDSDDLWVKEKLELQVKTIEEMKADLVFSNGFIFFENEVTDETKTFLLVVDGRFEGTDLFDLLLIENRIPILSVLMQRAVLDTVGWFEERRSYHGSEDYDLWLRLAKHGAVFYGMNERLVRYRRHSKSMTHRESDQLKPMIAVLKKHIPPNGGLDKKALKKRMRGLYRNLIAALLEESEVAEAKEYMKEFSAWDKSGIITTIQKVLLKVSPGKYSFISRECLYRIEWHFNKNFRINY